MGNKVKKFIPAICFMIIACIVFTMVTYLFRNTAYRVTVTGIKEEKNNIDVVCIGGSDTMVYYQPLRAYGEFGFTAYTMATDALPADAIKFYIAQSCKYSNPSLFVISLRDLWTCNLDIHEGYIRNASDSLDFPERTKLLNEYFGRRDDAVKRQEVDCLSYYLDIAYYHNNYEKVLASSANWSMLDNSAYCIDKGFSWNSNYMNCHTPDNKTDSVNEYSDERINILNDIIDYLKEHHLQALFVASPYEMTGAEMEKFNYMEQIVKEAGFLCLNTNKYYDEMGMDFQKDFYNSYHVNSYGAEKYTRFLSSYIKDNYQLEDHRGDEEYCSWEAEYQSFLERDKQSKAAIDQLVQESEQLRNEVKNISYCDNFIEWAGQISSNPQIGLVVVANGIDGKDLTPKDSGYLSDLGLDPSEMKDNYIRVVQNSYLIYSNEETGDNNISVILRAPDTKVEVNNCSENVEYKIDGKIYRRISERGEKTISILVWNCDYYEPVDFVTLVSGDNGKLEIERN